MAAFIELAAALFDLLLMQPLSWAIEACFTRSKTPLWKRLAGIAIWMLFATAIVAIALSLTSR